MAGTKSDVAVLLDRLAAGDVSIGEVVVDFAHRSWPGGPGRSADGATAAARAEEDPEPITPGSWAEVEAAYVQGRLTDRQYAALYHARDSNKPV